MLFVLLTLAAALIYFVARPGFVANRFIEHVNSGDIDSANAMFEWEDGFSHYWEMLKEQAKEDDREIFAHRNRPSFSNLIHFEREIVLESNTTGLGMSSQVNFKSTPTHVTLDPIK